MNQKQRATVAIGIMLALVGTRVEAQQLTQPTNSAPPFYSGYDTVQEELTIDSEINPGSILSEVKNKLIDFAIDSLNAETYLTDINQTVARIAGDIRTTLDDYGIAISKGKAGLPNVQEAKIIFAKDNELNVLNDIFSGQTGSTYANRDKLMQNYLKQLSEEYSNNSALSLEGQSKIEAKVNSAISSAQQSLTIASDSSGQDISQNIMRNISNQLALGQQADAMAIADMQDAKIDRSLDLQMQSEVLTELSGSNTRHLRETTATNGATISTLGLIMIPGMTEEGE